MRKKFGALIFISLILGGTLSPFFGAEEAKADSQGITDVFPLDPSWPASRVSQSALKLAEQPAAINATGALLNFNVKLQGPVEEITPTDLNGNQVMDTSDGAGCDFDCDNFGGWDSIFDSDVQNTTENGIFLVVGTQLSEVDVATSQNPIQSIPAPSRVDFNVYDPTASTAGVPQKLIAFGQPKAVNIGYYIAYAYGLYRDAAGNPVSQGNAELKNLELPVAGLVAGTQYYAQIFLVEDGGENVLKSNIISFTTLAADVPGATDPLPYNNDSTGTQTQDQQQALFGELIECNANPYTWVTGCLVYGWYIIFYNFSHWLLQMAGMLFDFFIGFALSSKVYGQTTFVYDGWKIVRDLSNIFFIFILMYAAIGTILKFHHFDAKKIIAKVIIIGLLINFSLFFTRIVIDASNVLARVFYNEITITNTEDSSLVNAEALGLEPKGLSAGIVEGMDIANLLSPENYQKVKESGNIGPGTMFLIITLGIIVNVITAWTFVTVCGYFIGRILGLWFAMIFAPLAFVTSIIPGLGSKLPRVGWGTWVKNLINLSVMAPLFVFFMYLIMAFLKSGFLSTMLASNNTNFNLAEFLVSIILQFMLVIGLIQGAKGLAKSLSGEFGEVASGIAGSVGGFVGGAALGVATGGLAIAGRSTVGSLIGRMNNEDNKKKATQAGLGGWIARRKLDMADYGNKGSFDVRQSAAANSLSQATGMNLNSGLSVPGLRVLNTANTAGGREGVQTRRQARLERNAERYGRENKGASHNIEHAIEERKKKIEEKEDNVERRQAELETAKGTGDQVKINAAQTALGDAKAQLRTVKNGEVDANGQPHVWEKNDIGKSKKADGSLVTEDDVKEKRKKTESMSLKDLEKALETNKKARAREYLLGQQKRAAAGNLTEEKRDALGNITEFGHFNEAAARQNGRTAARSFWREMRRGAPGGAVLGGIVGGAFTGGLGAGLGAVIGGAVTGSLSGWLSKVNLNLEAVNDAIHNNMATGKDKHAAHPPKDLYKGPASKFFTFFSKLGGSGGDHGGGHDDHGHGGGHDDHGGGGHH